MDDVNVICSNAPVASYAAAFTITIHVASICVCYLPFVVVLEDGFQDSHMSLVLLGLFELDVCSLRVVFFFLSYAYLFYWVCRFFQQCPCLERVKTCRCKGINSWTHHVIVCFLNIKVVRQSLLDYDPLSFIFFKSLT